MTGSIGNESDPFQLPSAPDFPTIGEGEQVPATEINGLDQRTLTSDGREISVVYNTEFSGYRNSFGSYFIDADGNITNVRLLAPDVEDALPDPNYPKIRPGGGPMEAGDTFSLGFVPEGVRYGFFIVSNGFNLNPADILEGEGRFELRDRQGGQADLDDTGGFTLVQIAPDGTETVVKGLVFVTSDSSAGEPNYNLLNPDGKGHVISGFDDETGSVVFAMDDQADTGPISVQNNDRDFNDVVFSIHFGDKPSNVLFLPDLQAQIDPLIKDADSDTMTAATAELTSGVKDGDFIALVNDANGDGIIDGTAISYTQVSETEITFSGEDSIANYELALNGIRYDNETDPSLGQRILTLTVTDDGGLTSKPYDVKIDIEDLIIAGNDADNILNGTDEADAMSGRGGNDTMSGAAGNDLIDGGSGDDIIRGDAGDDQIFGGPGRDQLFGGLGADKFNIGSLIFATDRVMDFNAAQGDKLDLTQLFESTDYIPGVSDQAELFQLNQVDGDNDGTADDIQVKVDLDGPGTNFAFQQIAVMIDPQGVTTSTDVDSIVITKPTQGSDGATS